MNTYPNLRRFAVASLFLVLFAVPLFAHAGHAHTYMGTVTTLHGDHGFTMKSIDGQLLTVETSKATSWLRPDGQAAKQSDLAVGERVVVKMMLDAKTAATVKIGAAKK